MLIRHKRRMSRHILTILFVKPMYVTQLWSQKQTTVGELCLHKVVEEVQEVVSCICRLIVCLDSVGTLFQESWRATPRLTWGPQNGEESSQLHNPRYLGVPRVERNQRGPFCRLVAFHC